MTATLSRVNTAWKPLPDPPGMDLRPDPDAIVTPADLSGALRAYRVWAGNVSYRNLAKRSGHRYAWGTFRNVLHRKTQPRLEMVREFLDACGCEEDYRERFEAAWRRIALTASDAADHPAERPDSGRHP